MYTQVVRVAVHNNFNCTDLEYDQLDGFRDKYQDRYFFTNSNINTPDLKNINRHLYKAVITLNPNIHLSEDEIKRLFLVDSDKVAFVRVKVIPQDKSITGLIKRLNKVGYNVMLTLQRFNGKKNLFTYSSLDHYVWQHKYRFTDKSRKCVVSLADSLDNVRICDRNQLGCKGCGLCAKLTLGEMKPIRTLNLSSSGLCKFSCPDCYAKTMQHFLASKKGCPTIIRTNEIYTNEKQAGRTGHIQMMIRKAEQEAIKVI